MEKLSLKDLRKKYQYDKKLRRFSDRHYFNDNSIYSRVQRNEDVTLHENYLLTVLEQLKRNFNLVSEDIEDLEKAMARYEIAVRKVIACFDNPHCNFIYNANELNELIEKVFKYHNSVDKLVQRKLYQD